MKISQAFQSKYLRGSDLIEGARRLTIKDVIMVDLQGQDHQEDYKPVIQFVDETKSLVLNKTNAMLLSASLGDDTEAWRGKQIELYSEKVPFQGRIVDAIRVRMPPPPPLPQNYDSDVEMINA